MPRREARAELDHAARIPISALYPVLRYVKLNEQIEGLTSLRTLGVRVLTVTEFVRRRSLETAQARLPGFHPENKPKMTDKPTAERSLQAFAGMALTIIQHAAGEDILRRLTPLSGGTGRHPATARIGYCSRRAT